MALLQGSSCRTLTWASFISPTLLLYFGPLVSLSNSRNKEGQLNLGDTHSRGDQPGETSAYFQDARLGLHESAVAVAAGAFFTCALLVPGKYVKCWG